MSHRSHGHVVHLGGNQFGQNLGWGRTAKSCSITGASGVLASFSTVTIGAAGSSCSFSV